MRRHSTSTGMVFIVCLLAGCADTQIQYTSKPDDPASPPEGGFTFGLRTASIVLAPKETAADDSTSANGGGDSKPKPKPAPKPKASMGQCLVPKVEDTKDQWWRECLSGTSASVTPISKGDVVYTASPHNTIFSKTTLTPKVSDADPLMITSVTFNSTSTIPGAISAGGAGAVTGFAWGPWGAVAGGVIGVVGSLASGGRDATDQKAEWWEQTCDWDDAAQLAGYKALKAVAPGGKVSASFPVALDYYPPKVGPNKVATKDGCWTSLPVAGTSVANGEQTAPPSGWFYRFEPNQKNVAKLTALPPVITRVDGTTRIPTNVVEATSFFAKDGATTDATNKFPVSACRTVDLQLTWWQELPRYPEDANKSVRVQTYSLVVADPTYVQLVSAPKHGSVTVLPVCGGYSNGGTPSTDVSDSISNLLKEVKDIRDAQSKPAKK